MTKNFLLDLPIRIFCFSFLIFTMLAASGTQGKAETKDSSQTGFKKNLLGFSTGLGFSGIRDQDPYYNSGKMLGSPNFAFVYQRNVLPHFGIRTGIGYVRKGDHYRYYTGFGSQLTSTKIIMNYIEVPVLLTLQSPTRFSPYMNAGMAFGYAIGETQIKTDAPLNNPAGFRKSIHKEIFNRLDNSLVASAGFKVNGKYSDFFLEIQYSYSVSDVFPYRSNNNVISFHTGFLFGK